MEIDKRIGELLYDYDCVIVPQLGGFVTNYKPATITVEKGVGRPAEKEIRFNKNLTKSDGLLAKAISNQEGLSFEEAGVALKQAVEDYWNKLYAGEKVRFRKIGVLYIDAHQNIRFEPTADQNFLKATFGFEPFSLPEPLVMAKPEKEESKAIEGSSVIKDAKELRMAPEAPLGASNNRGIYWVAAATLIPFLAMSIYVGMKTDFKSPSELSFADLNPFGSHVNVAAHYSKREEAAHKIAAEPIDFPITDTVFAFSLVNDEFDSAGVIIDMREPGARANELNKFDDDKAGFQKGIYHIIAGCFGDEQNAYQFVSRLKSKGYGAGVLDFHKGLHRVKLISFNEYSVALDTLKHLREDGVFPNAWLLKKHVS